MREPTVIQKINVKKLGIILLCWLIIGFLITIYDHFILHSDYSAGHGENYSFLGNLIFNLVAASIGAIFGGMFLIYVNDSYRDRPYFHGILAVFFMFFVIFGMITLSLSFVIAVMETGKSFGDPLLNKIFAQHLTDPVHVKNIIAWGSIVGLSGFFLQMNDKFGQGILWSMIKGKYHSPREEERIFMFLDLKSSTTIAEQLGIEKYYSLLKSLYSDITQSILNNNGQIYQYVGDEVVITWTIDKGVRECNCLNCFFDIRETLASLSEKYMKEYGVIPGFKAGLHYGKVIAGEVGIIKRDITYSGDVLNTAARIQAQCNKYNVRILSSQALLDLVKPTERFNTKSLGSITLKGKMEEVELSTIEVL